MRRLGEPYTASTAICTAGCEIQRRNTSTSVVGTSQLGAMRKPGCAHACRKVFGGYVDINIRMGASIMQAYLKGLGLGVDASWLKQMPQTTLLTGVKHPLTVGYHACDNI